MIQNFHIPNKSVRASFNVDHERVCTGSGKTFFSLGFAIAANPYNELVLGGDWISRFRKE